jgi:DNA-binding NarL/FixJ family response regulator
MLRDLLNEILGAEQDMWVVADGVEADELMEYVDREQPNVVLLAVPSGAPPAMAGELLDRFPRLTIVALEDRGQHASIYALRPIRFWLAEPSAAQLVSAIRRAAMPAPFVANLYDVDAGMLDTARPPAEGAGKSFGHRNTGEQSS